MRLRFALATVLVVSAAVACKSEQQSSEAKVVGGIKIDDSQVPSVRRFVVDQDQGRICTGVAVSHNTALMASHCIKTSTEMQGILDVTSKKTSIQFYAWQRLQNADTLTEEAAAWDLAVVVFPANTFSQIAKIGTPASGQPEVYVIGFGAASYKPGAPDDAAGVMRYGTNKIDSQTGELMLISAPINAEGKVATTDATRDSVAAPGDSGGPLLSKETPARVLAIGSALAMTEANGSTPGKATNYFVDLRSKQSQFLLNYAASEQRGEFRAEIEGVPGSNAPLDLASAPWAEKSAQGAIQGPLTAMCGGGGGGGGFGGNNGNTGNTGGFGGNTGNTGVGNTGVGNTGVGNTGVGNTGTGQNGGPGNTGAGAGNALTGKSKVQASCTTAQGCHGSTNHAQLPESSIKRQLKSPTGSMVSAAGAINTDPNVIAYMNSP